MTSALLIPCDTTQWIDENTLAFISIIVGVISIIITLLAIFGLKIALPHTHKWRKNQIDEIPSDFYGYYPNKYYIQPYFTFIDTESEDSAKHRLRDFFLKEVFVKNSTKPTLYCLLGDTGTGKTAALVHLYADYINRHSAKSTYQIKILSLRQEKVFDNINNIQDKGHCILLLDALDENPMAQDPDHRDVFDKEINNICRDFAFVVLTCRPQFFSNDNEESNQVETRIGDHQWLRYTRLKLSDFNSYQVQEYLDKVFSFRSDNELRQKAETIVNKHALIAIRPLVLNYIRDIVKSEREINTTLDFYDTIVQKQIHRELEKVSPKDITERTQQWWVITSEVAGYIYRKTNGTTEEKAITIYELQDIFHDQVNDELSHYLSSLNIALPHKKQEETQFLQRSLLTRTGDSFHFSHKSFYEYFMAYRFFIHPEEIGQVYGMDFALQLYNEICDFYSNQRQILFADLHAVDISIVADSLHNIGFSLYKTNHFTQAEPKYTKALEIRRKLAEANPNIFLPSVAQTLNNMGNLHYYIHDYTKAEQEYTESFDIRRHLAKTNPEVFLPLMTHTLLNIGELHRNTLNYPRAEQEFNEALIVYYYLESTTPNTYLSDIAMTLNNMGELHRDIHNYHQAEQEYTKALKIRRKLAEDNPDAFLPRIAIILNNLGELHHTTLYYMQAEQEFTEALKIFCQSAMTDPDAYIPYVATTLNNLATLHKDTNRYTEAEEEYNEALTIRRQLADKNPDAYPPYVATTLNNLANLHSDTNQLNKAEEEYNEALTTYRQLADKTPDAYLPDVAMTLNNLAVLHRNTNKYKEAEEEYNEALTILRQLADKNPDAYLPKVAMTLNNLANLHQNTNQLDKAEEEYNDALTTYRQLADKNPDAYLPYVATTLNNLANLHSAANQLDKTEVEYKAALTIRRHLADKYPNAYLHKVAQTLYNMALLHLARKEYPAAEAAAQESLEKYRIMAEKSHAAFDKYVKEVEELLEVIRKAK